MFVDRSLRGDQPAFRIDAVAGRRPPHRHPPGPAAVVAATGGGGPGSRPGHRAWRRDRAAGAGPAPGPRASARRGEPEDAYRVSRSPAAPAALVDRPISGVEVRLIASKGFPLWEAVPVMQLRNRRITVAYADLSRRLADLLARGGGERQANWCTYATWSSRTIGNWIDPERRPSRAAPPGGGGSSTGRRQRLTEVLAGRDNGATYRSLAAGNRYVFLEIGLAVACFLEYFERGGGEGPERAGLGRLLGAHDDRPRRAGHARPELAAHRVAPARRPAARDAPVLRGPAGRRPAARTEHVLAGNLLVGAYEQRRVDGYVTASLALYTGREMRRLVARRLPAGWPWWHRVPSTVYARAMSRFLVLETARRGAAGGAAAAAAGRRADVPSRTSTR